MEFENNLKSNSMKMGVVSLILGVTAFFMFATVINYIIAIAAIVFGIIQLKKSRKKAMAVTGIGMAILSMILTAMLLSGTVKYIGSEEGNYYLQKFLDEYSVRERLQGM